MECRSDRTHLDLFSGIGGFALAARWAGLQTTAFCEKDPYCQRVLRKNFPDVPIHDDVKTLDGTQFKDIFLITGGFPCQDISIAGKGAGIDGERSGLWTELHRIISEVRPRFALVENVPALTFRGGTRVIGDLTEIGYDCEWQIVGADDVGAPHKRKRIWIVAYSKSAGCQTWSSNRMGTEHGSRRNERLPPGASGTPETLAYSERTRWEKREGKTTSPVLRTQQHRGEDVAYSNSTGCKEQWRPISDGEEQPAAECRSRWKPEPSVGRVAHGIPKRVDRLRGIGNAIVPQVAYEIIHAMQGAECLESAR